MNDRIVSEWLISLLDREPKEFTPEVDAAMRELWERRDRAFGERRMIVSAFEAVLNYRMEQQFFTPHHFEQQDRLGFLEQEILRRCQALKNYVEKAECAAQ